MIKFILGVVLGFLFSKEIEYPNCFFDRLYIKNNYSEKNLSQNIRDSIHTVIG